MNLEWEIIDDFHQRAKIHGGWLVKAYENVCTHWETNYTPQLGYEWRIAMCFIPDPNYEWCIK